MKRDGFLFVVVAFAIFSGVILYLDYNDGCGSLPCVVDYVVDGQISDEIISSNEVREDRSKIENIINFVFSPFTGEKDILLQPLPTCSSVTQHGITWNFQSSVPCGQFANGDWWVLGPVTITSKTPAPTTSLNGDVIDPVWNNPSGQAFDSRIAPGPANPPTSFSGPTFNINLRPIYPINIDEFTHPLGASLVSTISQPAGALTNCGSGTDAGFEIISDLTQTFDNPKPCQRGSIKEMEILTIITDGETPLSGSFRPSPYFGVDKNAQPLNINQINYNNLGNVVATSSLLSIPLSQVLRHIERSRLELFHDNQESVTASDNAAGYGQFDANSLGLAALMVNSGDYSLNEKQPLVIAMIQRGLDNYGAYEYGDYTSWMGINYGHASWDAEGGLRLGHFFPIIFAGQMLNYEPMKTIGSSMNYDYFFSEQGSTFKVTDYSAQPSGYVLTKDMLVHSNYCDDGGVNCNEGGYALSELNLPEYGFAHYSAPNLDINSWDPSIASYKFCCTANTWNSYTLASYIMGIEDLWNAPEFLAYTDRYMEATDSNNPFFINPNIQPWMHSWYDAFGDMWNTYRSDYGSVEWTQAETCSNEGQVVLCNNQEGVCENSQGTCTLGNTYCDYESIPNYESFETTIDGLDNDCDGVVDEVDPPIAPSGLIVTQLDSDSLQIDWNHNDLNEAGFRLEYKLTSSSTWVTVPGAGNLPPNTLTYTQNSLSSYTSYDYRVTAYNTFGEATSNIGSAYTLPLTPVVSSINPSAVYNDLDQTITFLGSNFINQFVITARLLSNPGVEVVICSTNPFLGPTGCNFVNSGVVTADFDLTSFPADVYQVRYINIEPFLSGTGPLINSNYNVTLTVSNPPPTPTLIGFDQNPIMHNIERTLILSGTDLAQDFFIYAIPQGQGPFLYCSSLPTDQVCEWLSSTSVEVKIPQGTTPGNIDFQYVSVYDGGATLKPSINNAPLTIQATACLDGVQTQPCANQNGVCAGAVSQCVNGVFSACTSVDYESNNAAYNANEVGLCTDGLDNDCNIEYDHVGSGDGFVKGDSDCSIRVTSTSVPSTAVVGTNLNLVCTTDVSNVASAVDGSLNGVICPQSSSLGNNVNFNCLVSGTPGTTQTAGCWIDPNIAYDSGVPVESSIIQILASSCSGYSGQGACEFDSACDWVLGCSGSQSSGAADRCLPAGPVTYSCISGQCGATWTSGNSCASDEIPSSVSCSCISQTPILSDINGLSTVVLPWGSDSAITLNGQYFANNAQVFIDGVSITNSLTITPNSISFVANAEQFNVGSHSIRVVNPTTGLTSGSLTLRFSSSPVINFVIPNIVYNNVNNLVNISGIDFDPDYSFLFDGVDLTFLTTYINSGLIQFFVPSGGVSGQFNLMVVSGDGLASSSSVPLTLNYPFDYVVSADPNIVTVAQGYSFQSEIVFETLYDVTQEEIVVTVPDTPEATVSFVGFNSCTPSGPAPYPTCNVTIDVLVGSVAEQDYNLTVFAVSQTTGVTHQTTITMEGVVGTLADCTNGVQDAHEACQDGGGPICAPAGFLCSFGESCNLHNDCQVNPACSPPVGLCYSSALFPNPTCSPDQDCDAVPDTIDTCPSTPLGTSVGPLNGCPLPIATEFTSASTTNFLSVFDLNAVSSMNLRIDGLGAIQYANDVSVLRLVSGVHQALNLDNAVQISSNVISVDSLNYPELNGVATVSFEGLTFTDVTPMTRTSSSGSFVVCSASQCDDLSYNSGVFNMRVSGFSDYSVAQAQCGDTYCSLGETCSSCASDCGVCSGQPSSGNGGGGGGGGGGGAPRNPVVLSQCNDKKDNDGDGLIDYPADPGCFTLQDSSEIDENPLIDNNDVDNSNNVDTPLERVFEVRVVFWLVLIILLGGIVGVSTIILRDLIGNKKFNRLAKAVTPQTSQSQGTPPVGI